MRVGVGYDSHRFQEGTPLILGGVLIPDHPGLSAHSDGDALVHAVIDAVLGAAAEGDVGTHFPPSDDRWRDADSIALLTEAAGLLTKKGWTVLNVDAVVVTESPRIGPFSGEMRRRVARALGIGAGGWGWFGGGAGLAVHAVACLSERDSGDMPTPGR